MVNLVCPQDKLPLTSDLKCPKGHVYRQIDGIYDFLLGEPKNSDVLEKVAPFYEGIYAPLGFLITGRTRYSTILREAGFYSSGEEFLDIGTGPGKIFDYVSCQQCYGLDISLRFLRILKRNRKNVTPIRGDAMSLPFSDESFSGASAMFVIHMLSDPVQALSEMSRVLKRKGRCSLGLLTKNGWVANLLAKWWKLELRSESFYIGS
ncbi:class I SAM-dependent methyltransferase [Metallosphaera hakonensis]|uniref:class I SAM-dependent methyltransferase n=1 Tax=Metallosphaera hakonensis TaxID=79601 RepID=UPI000B1EE116|nr:class I SAM-dependent methyltransferase [Metallosphaera hakonensis]